MERESRPMKLLSESEVCEILNISHRTLRRWRNEGKLSFIRIGRHIRYPEEYIRELITKGLHKAENDIVEQEADDDIPY